MTSDGIWLARIIPVPDRPQRRPQEGDEPIIDLWTQADIDMIELAAVQGVEYLDLDESAYEDDA